MSFLTPWFLLGAAAIAGPILFHLIRQSVRERVTFSSLMFLNPTAQRVTRRRKLEDILLLLLRCLCLILLAAGFARPFFTRNAAVPPSALGGRQLVLLVDDSASMRRPGLWEKARAIASKYMASAEPGDQVAVVTFDRQPHTVVNFGDWSAWAADQRAALAAQRLAAISPGWLGTQLGLALTAGAERFTDDSVNGKPVSRRELVLISDLQEGARMDGLQGHDWPPGVQVVLERVDAASQANAGLEIAAVAADDNRIRARVTNARDSDREKFKLSWQGVSTPSNSVEIYLPAGQTRTFDAPPLPVGATSGRLELSGDAVDFDNQSYYVAPAASHVAIAWFGSDSDLDPQGMRFYLQRVFPDTPSRQVRLISPVVQNSFSLPLLNQSAFAVIPGKISADAAAAAHDWLAQGRTALFVVTDESAAASLATIAGWPGIGVSEAPGDYALLGDIDFTHPLFAPFADPRFSDFTHIHFWKHRRVDFPAAAQARILAKFDDGTPALAQVPVGKGNLLVLASGWNPADSQFALASKFPPLMQSMLDWCGASTPARFQFETGEPIPSPVAAGGAPVQWVKPDGSASTLAAGSAFGETDVPGVYTASFGGGRRQFAVNLPLDESRTAAMSPDDLARLGVPLRTPSELPAAELRQQQLHLQRSELENQQKLWRWLIVAVLAAMFAEIVLGGWLARRPLKPASST
jgi:hypothetical protein